MTKLHLRTLARISVSLGALIIAAASDAQTTLPPVAAPPIEASPEGIPDIIVTAQKRSESVNRIGMSISAASADTLADRGIVDTRDLAKLVTGFTFTETSAATPVYSIRGVGYYETSFAATPAVSVYVDQVPLPYPQMTRNAAFDLERVEVLKGPQGTLFGQNATGGAVNYIAAKPTSDTHAGFEITGGRFDQVDAQAYLSGPITDTLRARIAIGHSYGGDWQYSYTRPGDTRGRTDVSKGRLLLDWTPTSRLNIELGATGWSDRSDTLGSQLVARTSNLVPLPAFAAYPLTPSDPRAADWNPNFPKARNDRFYQLYGRLDYEVSDSLKLTSLTSYADQRIYSPVDVDGTSLELFEVETRGKLRSFNQEIRLAGDLARARWVIGGNYGRDRVSENDVANLSQSSTSINNFPPFLPVTQIAFRTDQKARTLAAFANLEYDLTDRLTVQGGVRYTDSRRDFHGCDADSGNGEFARGWSFLINNVFRPALGIPGAVNIPPGGCTTTDEQFTPTEATGVLKEHNVSWRGALNYKIGPSSLLYVNISKGYKAGTFPSLAGILVSEYAPTRQESVLAYEAGVKLGLFDRHLQLNAAGFYYDYSDKQIRGKIPDPIFGALEQLVNVPKSRVYGAEIQVTASPLDGLQLNGGVTYLNSKVTSSFQNYTAYGNPVDYRGDSFPYTPKWQATADAQYTVAVGADLHAFVGGSVLYNDKTVGFFGADVPYNPADPVHRNQQGQFPSLAIVNGALDIDAYTLLDARFGISGPGNRYKITVWGRNLTNKYYWTNASFVPGDATTRNPGRPATYGVTLAFKY